MRCLGLVLIASACGASHPATTGGQPPTVIPCRSTLPDGSERLHLELSFGVHIPCGEHGQGSSRLTMDRTPSGVVTATLGGCAGTALTAKTAAFSDHDATMTASVEDVVWNVAMTSLATCSWQGTLTIGDAAPLDFTANEEHLPVLE